MKKSKIVTVVIICLIIIFASLIGYSYFIKEKNGGSAAVSGGQQAGQQSGTRSTQAARTAITVRVTEVVPDTIEQSVVINGDVLARNQVSIFPTVGGKLVEIKLGIGDRVNRGDIVAMIDPSRPGEVYSQSPVISPISGTVLQAPFNIGDTLTTQSALYVVGDLSSLLVETFVPERFVSSVRIGLGAQVQLEAIPDEVFSAEVVEVSPVLDPASRTLRIHLRFVNRASGQNGADPRIKAGMFATISLVTNRRINVPVIPRVSVINSYGSWFVFTVDQNNVVSRHEVLLGIDNENFFEIISGVSLGDRVVSAGQNFLTAGDPVRIVD